MPAPRICALLLLAAVSGPTGGALAAVPVRLAIVEPGPREAPAVRTTLRPALFAPPRPEALELLRLAAPSPEELPAQAEALGVQAVVWGRVAADGTLELHAYRTATGELLVAPVAVPPGAPPEAVAEAVWLRIEFLLQSPPGSGRRWPHALPPPPPPEPPGAAPGPPTGPVFPLPPDIPVPEPPAPLPGPPPPRGEVEVTIEALPGARKPTVLFSQTAEHGAPPPPPAPPAPAAAPAAAPGRVLLTLDALMLSPGAKGLGLAGDLPLVSPLELRVALRVFPLHEPWDRHRGAGTGAPSFWSEWIEAGVGARLAQDGVAVRVRAGLFLACLQAAGEADVLERWQLGPVGGTEVSFPVGPVEAVAGLAFGAATPALQARVDGATVALAERLQLLASFGLALPLGRP